MSSVDNIRVCGLCSQLVDSSVDLDDVTLDFLRALLNSDPGIPSKLCRDCYSSALEAKRFKESCLKAIQKIRRSNISSSIILGSQIEGTKTSPHLRSPSPSKYDELQVQIPIAEKLKADKKLEEGREPSRPPKNRPLKRSLSSSPKPASKKKVKASPALQSPTKTLPKRNASATTTTTSSTTSSSKDLDAPEVFPSVGPYQCEICFSITDTKPEFVEHIKNKHKDVVDEEILKTLELDLKKAQRTKQKKIKTLPLEESSPASEGYSSASEGPSNGSSSNSSKSSITCPICSMTILHRHNLKKHQKSKTCRKIHKSAEQRKSSESPKAGPTPIHKKKNECDGSSNILQERLPLEEKDPLGGDIEEEEEEDPLKIPASDEALQEEVGTPSMNGNESDSVNKAISIHPPKEKCGPIMEPVVDDIFVEKSPISPPLPEPPKHKAPSRKIEEIEPTI